MALPELVRYVAAHCASNRINLYFIASEMGWTIKDVSHFLDALASPTTGMLHALAKRTGLDASRLVDLLRD